MNISHTFAAATAALALAAAPAFAGEHKPRSIAIDVSGYDLNSEAGIDAVYSKIKTAAKRVCRAPGRPTLAEQVVLRNCVEQSIVNAIESMDSPQLKQAFAKRAGVSLG